MSHSLKCYFNFTCQGGNNAPFVLYVKEFEFPYLSILKQNEIASIQQINFNSIVSINTNNRPRKSFSKRHFQRGHRKTTKCDINFYCKQLRPGSLSILQPFITSLVVCCMEWWVNEKLRTFRKSFRYSIWLTIVKTAELHTFNDPSDPKFNSHILFLVQVEWQWPL